MEIDVETDRQLVLKSGSELIVHPVRCMALEQAILSLKGMGDSEEVVKRAKAFLDFLEGR